MITSVREKPQARDGISERLRASRRDKAHRIGPPQRRHHRTCRRVSDVGDFDLDDERGAIRYGLDRPPPEIVAAGWRRRAGAGAPPAAIDEVEPAVDTTGERSCGRYSEREARVGE